MITHTLFIYQYVQSQKYLHHLSTFQTHSYSYMHAEHTCLITLNKYDFLETMKRRRYHWPEHQLGGYYKVPNNIMV